MVDDGFVRPGSRSGRRRQDTGTQPHRTGIRVRRLGSAVRGGRGGRQADRWTFRGDRAGTASSVAGEGRLTRYQREQRRPIRRSATWMGALNARITACERGGGNIQTTDRSAANSTLPTTDRSALLPSCLKTSVTIASSRTESRALVIVTPVACDATWSARAISSIADEAMSRSERSFNLARTGGCAAPVAFACAWARTVPIRDTLVLRRAPRRSQWIVRHAHGATSAEPEHGDIVGLPVRRATDSRTARHRAHPRHVGRQDRAEPSDERDAGGDGAGAVPGPGSSISTRCGPRWKVATPGCRRRSPTCSPNRLVNSEVDEIPEGWPLVPLPELMDVNPPRPLQKGDVAPYLDMANMPTLGHAPDSVVRRPFGSGTRFANGDTLVARITPCLENGKTAYVDFLRDDEIGWGSTEYIVMKPRRPLPSEFAYLLARTARFREFAIQNMSGTSGRQRVSASALSGFSMPSPPEAIGLEFGHAAQLLLGRARAAVDERCVLANCRDALLPRLISGKMRVGDAEKLVGAIA